MLESRKCVALRVEVWGFGASRVELGASRVEV